MIRIVKMTFVPENISLFYQIFEESKALIRGFEGCNYMELLQDKTDPRIHFTYSFWDSEEHLNNYRKSALFKGVWSKTKALFELPAEAWSVEALDRP